MTCFFRTAVLVLIAFFASSALAQAPDSSRSKASPDPDQPPPPSWSQPARTGSDVQRGAGASGGGEDNAPALPVHSFATSPDVTGALGNSVNLFTGDVALPIPLVSLPGRDGLGVAVSASYSSNTERALQTWNVEAPTGILGLGWSLGFDRIIVDPRGTGTRSDDEYYFAGGGSTQPLVEQDPPQSATYRLFRTRTQPNWEFHYTESSEQWLVYRDDGIVLEFGNKNSGRNTVAWGIRWENYLGPAFDVVGQEHYALAWNLSQVTNLFGESVRYAYIADERKLGQGSGSGAGLSFTEASYLQRIESADGRAIEFVYGDKCDGNGQGDCQNVGSRAEFMDPHIESNEPDAYQERYERRFLQRLDAKAATGDVLFHVDFSYDFTGAGELAKRRLGSITHRVPNGETLPPLEFEYKRPNATNPSALRLVRTPNGAEAAYTYTTTVPGKGDLELTVNRPSGYNGEPRIWHGTDYVVIGWHKPISGQTDKVRIEVYQWVAGWVGGPIGSDIDAEQKDYGFPVGERQNYEVFLENDFFAVVNHFYEPLSEGSSTVTTARLYYKNRDASGAWIKSGGYRIDADDRSSISVATGDQFFAYTCKRTGDLGVFTWTGTQWSSERFDWEYPKTTMWDRFLLAGRGNYLIVHHYKRGVPEEAYIHHVDGRGNWARGDNFLPEEFALDNISEFSWQAGDTYAIAAGNFDIDGDYSERLFYWDESFQDVQHIDTGSLDDSDGSPVSYPLGSLAAVKGRNGGTPEVELRHRNGLGWASASRGYSSGGLGGFSGGPGFVVSGAPGNPEQISNHTYDPTNDEFITATGASVPNASLGVAAGYNYYLYFRFHDSSEPVYVKVRQRNGNWASYTLPLGYHTERVFTNPTFFLVESYPYQTSRAYYLRNGQVDTDAYTNFSRAVSNGSLAGQPIRAAGPNSFSTYCCSSEIADASQITIRRVVDGKSTGTREDHPVASVTIDDGFQEQVTAFDYTPTSATYDPSGTVAQYNQVETYVGGLGSNGKPLYGSTETFFFNGLPSDELPTEAEHPSGWYANTDDYLSLLTGTPYRVRTLDYLGATVAEEETFYHVYTPPMNGGTAYLARPRTSKSTRDGVLTTVTREFNDDNGYLEVEEVENSVPHPDGSGALEHTTRTRYKYFQQGYPAGPAHLESPVIEVETSDSSLRWSVTTWKDWGNGWAPHRTYVWKGGLDDDPPPPPCAPNCLTGGGGPEGPGDPPTPGPGPGDDYQITYRFSPFFSDWGASQNPGSQWLRTSRVLARTDWGAVRMSEGVDSVRSSVQYDGAGYPVAQFTNASITTSTSWQGTDASWLDFESGNETNGHPDNDRWTLYAENTFSGDAHSGRKSRKLVGGSSAFGPTRVFYPTDQEGRYVLSMWVKTEPGFGENQGEFVFYTRTEGSHASYPDVSASNQSFRIGDTRGEWVYLERVIDLAVVRSTGSVPSATDLLFQVYIDNYDASKYLLVDDIRFSPLMGGFTASVYDPTFRTVTAAHGVNGSVAYTSFDTFGRAVEARDRRGRVLGESFSVLSCEKTAGAFDRSQPNESFSRSYPTANLIRNGSFERGLTASGLPLDLHWVESALTVTAAPGRTGRYALRAYANEAEGVFNTLLYDRASLAPSTTYRYAFWAKCEGGSSCAVTVNINREYQVNAAEQRSVNGSSWRRYTGTLTTNSNAIWDDTTLDPTFHLELEEAGRTVTFDDLQLFRAASPDPFSASVVYTDGAGKPRQSQVRETSGLTVQETLYDKAGRAVAQTKPVYGSGSSVPFGYRADLVVDTDGRFGENNPEGGSLGPMSGLVAALYPETGGYPYTQTRFERSPLSRPLEMSVPGSGYQIGSGNTTRYAYGSNETSGSFPGSLPVDNFFLTTTTDADGNTSTSIADRQGRTVGREAPPLTLVSGATVRPVTWYDFNARGDLWRVRLPKFDENPAFALVTEFDVFGRPVKSVSPDQADTTRTVYDRAGRPRFTQHADGAAEGYFLYTKYDRVGRAINSGYYVQAWDEAFLQDKADTDPAWPVTPFTWRQRSIYDSHGDAVTGQQGRLLFTETNADASKFPDASEHYTYDERGRLTRVALRVNAYGADEHAIVYDYNDRGDVTLARYGDAAVSSVSVAYSYDARGRVTAIGMPGDPDFYTSYRYRGDGRIASRTFPWPVGRQIDVPRLSYDYDGQGRLTRISTAAFEETLTYESGGYGGFGGHRGLIASASYSYPTLSSPDPFNHTYRFDYDALGQLTAADHSADNAFDIGVGLPTRYDQHGNIARMRRGAATQTYAYFPGTNRVRNTGGNLSTYLYDRRGNVTTLTPRSITDVDYDPFTSLPTRLTTGGETTTYGYLGRRRAFKAAPGQEKVLYLHGASGQPFAERTPTGLRLFVRGPDGLVAMRTVAAQAQPPEGGGGGTQAINYVTDVYHVASDHLGSTRVMVGEDGELVEAYSYGAWGEVAASVQLGRGVGYTFTGQEEDTESGLMNYRARLYDPALGRFLGVDPAGEFASPYLYAANNPASFTDPTGMFVAEAALAFKTGMKIYAAYKFARAAHRVGDGFNSGGLGGGVAAFMGEAGSFMTAYAMNEALGVGLDQLGLGSVGGDQSSFFACEPPDCYEGGPLFEDVPVNADPLERINFGQGFSGFGRAASDALFADRTHVDYRYGDGSFYAQEYASFGEPVMGMPPIIGPKALSGLRAFGARGSLQGVGQTVGRAGKYLKTLRRPSSLTREFGKPLAQIETRLEGGWGGAREMYRQLTGEIPSGLDTVWKRVGNMRVIFRKSKEGWPTIEIIKQGLKEKIRFL